MIKVGFELEMDEGVYAPSPSRLVQALSEALPKEWWADRREDTWGVKTLFALNDDGTLQQSDHWLRPVDTGKQAEFLKAQLNAEQKLTAHLDEQIKNQKALLQAQSLELSGRAGTITGQKTRIQNLTEKNDNQYTIIGDYGQQVEGLIESNTELQSKYDDSLLDWKVVTSERDAADEELGDMQEEMKAVEKQRDDAVSRADRNYASSLSWERKYDDANALNKDLVTERDGLMDTVRNDTATVERLRGDLLACQSSNRNHLGESKVTEEMVARIVDAMESAGYEIAGWGNDTDLEELETTAGGIRTYLDDASSELGILSDQLDKVRTER